MNKIVVAFLFCLTSSIAYAQAFEARKPVLCDSIQTLVKSLTENYNEKPIWMAINPVDNTRFSLFVNDKEGSWTLIQFTSDVACILGVGTDSKLLLGAPV